MFAVAGCSNLSPRMNSNGSGGLCPHPFSIMINLDLGFWWREVFVVGGCVGGVIPMTTLLLAVKAAASYINSLSIAPVGPGVRAGLGVSNLFGGYCTGFTVTNGNNTGNSYSVSNVSNNASNFMHRAFGTGRLAASRTVYN